MKRLMTGRCGYSGAVLVPKPLALGLEVVASYEHGGLKDQDCRYNFRWMQKARP